MRPKVLFLRSQTGMTVSCDVCTDDQLRRAVQLVCLEPFSLFCRGRPFVSLHCVETGDTIYVHPRVAGGASLVDQCAEAFVGVSVLLQSKSLLQAISSSPGPHSLGSL